jgi:hypothetical protein
LIVAVDGKDDLAARALDDADGAGDPRLEVADRMFLAKRAWLDGGEGVRVVIRRRRLGEAERSGPELWQAFWLAGAGILADDEG